MIQTVLIRDLICLSEEDDFYDLFEEVSEEKNAEDHREYDEEAFCRVEGDDIAVSDGCDVADCVVDGVEILNDPVIVGDLDVYGRIVYPAVVGSIGTVGIILKDLVAYCKESNTQIVRPQKSNIDDASNAIPMTPLECIFNHHHQILIYLVGIV